MWIEFRLSDPVLAAIVGRGFAGYPRRDERRGSEQWAKIQVPSSRLELNRALTVLVEMNLAIYKRARQLGVRNRIPPLYRSGVRYVREPDGREWWQTILDNLRERQGDCEDLGAARAAELIDTGEDPHAKAEAIQTGPLMFHAITVRSSGELEDPSAALGMNPLNLAARRRALQHYGVPT